MSKTPVKSTRMDRVLAVPGRTAEVLPEVPAEPRDFSSLQLSRGVSPPLTHELLRGLSPFWHDRLIEAGLILTLGLYYTVGNPDLGAGSFFHLPPYLYSFPFLALFALLSWYRLSFAVALMPLALPYYLIQKTVFSADSRSFAFSLAEIALTVCALVALGQCLLYGKRWRYRLSWAELRERLGPFGLPILVFCGAALLSLVIAVNRQTALRAFHEEVLAPLLYGLLALSCLRTRQDMQRLVWAFLGSAMLIALAGLVQYFFLLDHLHLSQGDDRAHAMYGSANSIGLFFDYALPLGMAMLIFRVRAALCGRGTWWAALLILGGFAPLLGVLFFSQSLGAALALPVSLLFILALSARRRKTLLLGAGLLLLLALGVGVVLHRPLLHFLMNWHDNRQGIGTLSKRYYLWQAAWHMIQSYPWLGVGLDNWLCHYSVNTACPVSQIVSPHFWIITVPGTHTPTGLQFEPTLSHPHNIFLQIWLSIGVFGLLAFVTILALFVWLFTRIVATVRRSTSVEVAASLEWLVSGLGGAMLAALCQGLIDSSVLEQDLAFCFWTMVASLLILRVLTGTAWREARANYTEV